MDLHNGNGWPPSSVPGAPMPATDPHSQLQQRPLADYGSNHPLQQRTSIRMNVPISLPAPGPFLNSQTSGNPLPALVGLAQASPRQASHLPATLQQRLSPPIPQQHQTQGHIHQSQQGPGYALPAITQAIQQQSPHITSAADRERDYREAELREQADRQRQDAMMQHEQEREMQEQRSLERQSPLENHTGSIPLQQPVASRIPATLHGPNGILSSNLNVGAGLPQPAPSLGAPNGPSNIFTNGVLSNDGLARNFSQQQGHTAPPQSLLSFIPPMAPQQVSNGVTALSQGQQPILNDALGYLDQVKVRFQEQPDVYNKFLDIMKDFKSQAIDTPGVIDRVSTLFNGHPELIQGFNTFLPPGYRIECGTNDDPNSIRVTTPMGTTVSSMSNIHGHTNGGMNGNLMEIANGSSPHHRYSNGGYRSIDSNWQQQHHVETRSEGPFSPTARPGPQISFLQQPVARQGTVPYGPREEEISAADAAAIAHQQEQQGVSQLQSAVSAATTESIQGRSSAIPAPSVEGSSGTLGQAVQGLSNVGMGHLVGAQLGMEKRGPVEFNHAINYVNKIKNRFATQPEIYKQFLEILQTYQRESKPIQDVYAQVTQLFNAAPDLLEDFKQFLPESAAQAKAQAAARQAEDAAMLSNVRGDASYLPGMPLAQVHTPRPEAKMPPIGNFAPPPSVGKDNKKRRGGAGSQLTIGGASNSMLDHASLSNANRNGTQQASNINKRARMSLGKPPGSDPPAVSPSLIPELPRPMPPSTSNNTTPEEVAFFDRVKKYLANKSTFNEFLKLCNLFTQELIDKNTLVYMAEKFIGQNNDLFGWFKKFVGWKGHDEVIENKPIQSDTKVLLSNCRGLGPSYRLLPKRERLTKCTGRDELCYQVLNNDWASHPTWASEDSGFIAHRKNVFEDSLHRIEEERHDYDFNIETNSRTIQLLEPIVQQINLMTPEEKARYELPPGLGGQSEAIYQRVIKKLYGRERGGTVIHDMLHRPTYVCPVVLQRLKQKLEEWKASQREWEKVWRDQTNKQFWRSLDHQGLIAKAENKRQFQPKALQTDIQTKYEEQKRQRLLRSARTPKWQFKYSFNDVDVIQDACHILLTSVRHTHTGNVGDQGKVETFLKAFIPIFFGFDRDIFLQRMNDIYDDSPPNEENEEFIANDDPTVHRGRRGGNGRKGTLLRGVLDRGQSGKQGRKDKENSATLESKESTPDAISVEEYSITLTDSPLEQPSRLDPTEQRWMEHPTNGNGFRDTQTLKVNEPFYRDNFTLYANINIYCFMRMLELLYERLLRIKENEERVHEDVQRAQAPKPAIDLIISDRSPSSFFADTSPTANYYSQILKMCEATIKGEDDMTHFEDTLRRFYMVHGFQLYSFDKMLAAIIRFALQSLTNDAKDKSSDIIHLFYKNRKENETTHQAEIDYRKQVEKLAKDSDIYRIIYNRLAQQMTVQIFKQDEKTFDVDELTIESRWSYYVASYVMRDWTEGVPHDIQWPFLRRNLPKDLETDEDFGHAYLPRWNEDGLIVRICANNYHLLYEGETADWWVHDEKMRRRGLSRAKALQQEKAAKFEELYGKNAKWMADMEADEVEKTVTAFETLIKGMSTADDDTVSKSKGDDKNLTDE